MAREHGGADTVTCFKVLNVIKEYEARINVIENCYRFLRPGRTAYITVYEGVKGKEAGPTKSGYQMNRSTQDYLEEIQSVFPNAVRKGKLIIATN